MSNRLDGEAVQDHPLRRAIMDVARRVPGITFTDLLERLRSIRPSLGFGSLTHHLRVLERHRHLTSRRSGRCRRYYEAGGRLGDPTRLSALQRPGALGLLRVLTRMGAPSQAQIVRALQALGPAPRQSVAYQLDRLRAAGVVAVERAGREHRYRLTGPMSSLFGMRLPPESG